MTEILKFGLAKQLAEAVAKDEAPEEGGFDLSAGLFGRHVSSWLHLTGATIATHATKQPVAFQQRVKFWILSCFGVEISNDKVERNHRFLEEALELVQSTGCTQSEAHQLVNYVFGRPVGEPFQEVGGVQVTLAALCEAHGIDSNQAAETELTRIWAKIEQIRAKQAAKPKHGPLPE